jgi:hypothetical protein
MDCSEANTKDFLPKSPRLETGSEVRRAETAEQSGAGRTHENGASRFWSCWTPVLPSQLALEVTTPAASSWNRKKRRVARRFADPGAQIPSPSTRITAVHDTGDETELLCHVATILANVVSAGRGVLAHEFVNVVGFGKDVGCVPELRDFGDDRGATVEDEFVAE